MARQFDIPHFYRSSVVSTIKNARRTGDRTKRDLSPSVLDLGPVQFKIARHFGFCFGVENAIEIAYRAVEENPGKRVFLLSEMIHNPHVNSDLRSRGVEFLLTPEGKQLWPFEDLKSTDVVIVPAFGTTVELFRRLEEIGIDPRTYNATCPFVERVWKRGNAIAKKGFTIVIHGKHDHEETRATFSHTCGSAPGVVVRDMIQARRLADYISGKRDLSEFEADFSGLTSEGFDPAKHLQRIGVINQTTMLATETQAISVMLRDAIKVRYGTESLSHHFADTRDTLCYATTENQEAVKSLMESGGDLALVVGGYNSSNTSHLVELLEPVVPTFYVKDAEELVSQDEIRHLDLESRKVITSHNWYPLKDGPIRILITAGASCPDAQVDAVISRVAGFHDALNRLDEALIPFVDMLEQGEDLVSIGS